MIEEIEEGLQILRVYQLRTPKHQIQISLRKHQDCQVMTKVSLDR